MSEALGDGDRLAVQELVSRYAWALDTSDADLMASVFTPDGAFIGDLGTYTGHAQLRSWVESRSAALRATQHFVSNVMLTFEGDVILERSACLIIGDGGSQSGVQSSGFYRGRVVRHDGAWLFAERSFHHW